MATKHMVNEFWVKIKNKNRNLRVCWNMSKYVLGCYLLTTILVFIAKNSYIEMNKNK